MARTARPWYRPKRDEWRVYLQGKNHFLGKHPEGVPPPRKQRGKWTIPQPILDLFDQLKAQKDTLPVILPPVLNVGLPVVPASPLVVTIADQFLEWVQAHREPRTYDWTKNHIQSFVSFLENKKLTVAELKPFHVQQWVDANKATKQKKAGAPGKRAWGPNHTRGAIIAVQRTFTWAEKMGHIDRSPIRYIEKPAAKRREQFLTQAEFDHLLSHVEDTAFRDVLVFCWETGARVQEVRLIRAEHVKLERGRIELSPTEAKGKKRWRIIYLTDPATDIIRRLCLEHPEDFLFRNMDGKQWDAQNFNNRFCRIQCSMGRQKLGPITHDPAKVEALARTLPKTKTVAGKEVLKSDKELLREARKKLSKEQAARVGIKYTLTSLRHSYCQRLLEAGVDHTTVAALMGHSNAVMVSTTYSHMSQAKDFLREELTRVSNASRAA